MPWRMLCLLATGRVTAAGEALMAHGTPTRSAEVRAAVMWLWKLEDAIPHRVVKPNNGVQQHPTM